MRNLRPTLRYVKLTVVHKWFVFVAGLRLGAPLWRLIIHDWSKFLPSEVGHYGRQFFGTKDDPDGFGRAWLLHQNRHPHHWEFWIPRTSHTKSSGRRRFGVTLTRGAAAVTDGATGRLVTPYVPRQFAFDLPGDRGRGLDRRATHFWGPGIESDQAVVMLSNLCDTLNATDSEPLPMPEWAIREMVAEWLGASRAYERRWPTADSWPWWEKQRWKIRLHPETRRRVDVLVSDYFEASR